MPVTITTIEIKTRSDIIIILIVAFISIVVEKIIISIVGVFSAVVTTTHSYSGVYFLQFNAVQ